MGHFSRAPKPKNDDDLADLATNWAVVQQFLSSARLNTVMPLFVSHRFANLAYGLVLVHSCVCRPAAGLGAVPRSRALSDVRPQP